MSQKRQSAILDPRRRAEAQVATLAYDYPPVYKVPWHFHDWDQLVYASSGVMTVRTSEGTWVVPTHRAVWIPAGVPHTITMSGSVAMRTLYLRPALARALTRGCSVINVSPLLRELILHACTFPALKKKIRSQRHLIDVIVDQLASIQTVPLQLPNPSDPRARRIAEALLADPADRRSLEVICKAAGAGKRTVERLFQENVGMSFGKWRQQLRLLTAMQLLGRQKGNARRTGGRLQHAERIHLHVQKSARHHTIVVLSGGRKIRLGTTPMRS